MKNYCSDTLDEWILMVDGGWWMVGGWWLVVVLYYLQVSLMLRVPCDLRALRKSCVPASLRRNFIELWDARFIFNNFMLFLNVQLNNIYWLVA